MRTRIGLLVLLATILPAYASAQTAVSPLPIAAQTDFGGLRVSPLLSPGPARPLIGLAQSEDGESSGVPKSVLIGAGIGAGIGVGVVLVVSEIFPYCDPADNSPTYACTINRGKGVLLGGLAGAFVGAAIGAVIGEFTGSRDSSQEWSGTAYPDGLHNGLH